MIKREQQKKKNDHNNKMMCHTRCLENKQTTATAKSCCQVKSLQAFLGDVEHHGIWYSNGEVKECSVDEACSVAEEIEGYGDTVGSCHGTENRSVIGLGVISDDRDVLVGDVDRSHVGLTIVPGVWRHTERLEGPGQGSHVTRSGLQIQPILFVLLEDVANIVEISLTTDFDVLDFTDTFVELVIADFGVLSEVLAVVSRVDF